MHSDKKNRRISMPVRILAVIVALLMIIPIANAFANDNQPDNLAEVGLSGNTGEEGNETNQGNDEITIKASDITIRLNEANSDLDLLNGVTAVGVKGEDLTSYLVAETDKEIDFSKVGVYVINYFVRIDGENVAHTEAFLKIVGDYDVVAENLTVNVGQYASVDEIDFMQDVKVTNVDGVDVTSDVTYTLPVGENAINLTLSGEYKVAYSVLNNEEKPVFEFSRSLIVKEDGITVDAPELYFSAYFDDDEKVLESADNELLLSINVTDKDDNDLSEYLVLTDKNGFALNKPGTYSVKISVVKDEETLTTFTRKVFVQASISTFASGDSRTLGGDSARGDQLKVSFTAGKGNAIVHRWANRPIPYTPNVEPNKSWVGFYYSASDSSSSGTSIRFNGKTYFSKEGSLGNSGSMNPLNIDIGTRFEVNDVEKIQRTYTLPNKENPELVVVETISVAIGEPIIRRDYKLTNVSGTTMTDVSLIYGADTYFAGFDCGFGEFSAAGGGTATIFRDASQGIMQFKGLPGYKPSSYFVGLYSTLGTLMSKGKLNNVSPTNTDKNFPTDNPTAWWNPNTNAAVTSRGYIDQAYGLEWDKDVLEPGKSFEVKSEETFADAGKIQIFSEGSKDAPPGVPVTHRFTVKNIDIVGGQTFNDLKFTATSSHNWSWYVNPQIIPAIGPGETDYVNVTVWIPEKQPDGSDWPQGTEDILKLTATFDDIQGNSYSETAESITRTKIDHDMALITGVPIMALDDNILSVAINYVNVPADQRPVDFELTILDGATFEPVTTIAPIYKTLESGGQIENIDITSLIAGKKYIVNVKAVDPNVIPYPNDSTTFTYKVDYVIAVRSLQVKPKVVNMIPGETYDDFIITYNPTNATDTAVKHFSNNPSVATVDPDTGLVTALTEGEATITVQLVTNDTIKDTYKVVVADQSISSLTVTPKEFTFKADPSMTAMDTAKVTINPSTVSDKLLEVRIGDEDIVNAYFDYDQDPVANPPSHIQDLVVFPGTKDGTTKVEIIRARDLNNPVITPLEFVTVNVDGTAPNINSVTLEKTNQNWKRIVTNKQIKVTVTANDPVVNNFASGVGSIYVLAQNPSLAAPSFDPNNLGSWQKMNTASVATFMLDSNSNPTGSDFAVYVVAMDKVGNFTNVKKHDEDIEVDIEIPEIKVPSGFSQDIHVVVGTPITDTMIRQNVVATDNGVSIVNKLVISPNPNDIITTTPSAHPVTLSYTDDAGNSASLVRTVYVHGLPTVTANATVNVNYDEYEISLNNTADNRINLKTPSVIYYNSSKAQATGNSTVTVTGTHVTGGNKLALNSITPKPVNGAPTSTTVSYKASFANPWPEIGAKEANKAVNFVVYANGDVPGTPDPENPGPGIITPPVNPPVIPPGPGLDPTPEIDDSIYRIRYYIGHGVLKSDNTTQPGLTVAEIVSAVNAANADSKTVYINPNGIGRPGRVELTAGSLQAALATIGQKEITYEFENSAGKTMYYVYLEVNSNIVWDVANNKTIDTQVGRTVSAGDYTNPNAPSATYKDYRNRTIALTVTAPTSIDTTTIKSYNVNYSANYPFKAQTKERLIRVHGKVEFTANPALVHLRVKGVVPTIGVTGSVKLAPINAGTTTTNQSVNVVMGTAINTDNAGDYTQIYNGTANLPASYSSSYQVTGSYDRAIAVHPNPTITANNLTKGLGYTAAMLGDPRTNAQVGAKAEITYSAGLGTNDLTGDILDVDISAVKFGVKGTYDIVFKVSDSNASKKPSGLPAATTTYKSQITITDQMVGDGVSFKGISNRDWVANTGKTVANLLSGVTAVDNGTGQVLNNVSVTLAKVSDGTPVAFDVAAKNFGEYKILYSVVSLDSGDVVTDDSKVLRVYGEIKIDLATVKNISYRIGLPQEAVAASINSIKAKYTNFNGQSVELTPSTHSNNFSIPASNLNTVGRNTGKIVVDHPIDFNNKNEAPLVIDVYSEILVKGITELSAPVRRAGNGALNLLEGVTATYTGPDAAGSVVTFTISGITTSSSDIAVSNNTLAPTSAGQYKVKYVVKDDKFANNDKDYTATFKYDIVNKPNISKTNIVVPKAQTNNMTVIRRFVGPGNTSNYLNTAPTAQKVIAQSTYIYDMSERPASPQPGNTYNMYIYYMNVNGIKSDVITVKVTVS